MKIDKSKYIIRFVDEAVEHLEKIKSGVLALEKDVTDKEMMTQVFRSAHSIKGSSEMLGLALIGELSHKMEDALEALKVGAINTGFFDVIFRTLDTLSLMVEQVKSGGENDQDLTDIYDELQRAAAGEVVGEIKTESKPIEPSEVKQAVVSESSHVEKTTVASRPVRKSSPRAKIDKRKYINRFVDEAVEHLEKMGSGILALAKDMTDKEMMNQVFRSAHSIKGSSEIDGAHINR